MIMSRFQSMKIILLKDILTGVKKLLSLRRQKIPWTYVISDLNGK